MWAMGFSVVLTLAMAAVIWLDVTRYLIPNGLNGFIAFLWVCALFFLPIDPLMSLAAAAIVLAVGLGVFALGLMGGGDIKLLVVLTLWTGWGITSAHFLMLTAIAGGALVMLILPLRLCAGVIWRGKELPRLLTQKQPVPYGLAIAAAFLILMWRGAIPALA